MDLNPILERLAADLDIPLDVAEEAIVEYESVADWLSAEGSDLRADSPEIYPQGSFRLGTPVRPLKGDDFDIDLVCRLALKKEETTTANLKNRVGDRLKASAEHSGRLNECGRCWTLTYGTKFHLDVLPCIPDQEGTSTSILLTDKDLVRWQHSNPIGYADWFFSRMGPSLLEEERRLAAVASIEVADVPRWQVRTPLQRGVQLLKRHRDVYFKDDPNNCPASIIVTTLAAHSYAEERDLFSALLNMVRRMPSKIENRDSRWWIANPAHPSENFADKWNDSPTRRTRLLEWLARLEQELTGATRVLNESEANDDVAKRFGLRSDSLVTTAVSVPALASESHVQPPPWPAKLTYRCDIHGHVYRKLHAGRALWPLTDRAVPKHFGLRFEVKTNTPLPFEVKWQVTNTGQEAATAGQLRGRFEDGETTSSKVHWESTLYAGTHWVEASVIKDGVCVAKSGRKLVRVRQ